MSDIVATLATVDLFRDLSTKELEDVSRLLAARSIPAGTEFITEGDVGRDAYVITEGEASVWRGGQLVTTVGPGDIVGEMAVVSRAPRTATVRAETALHVEVLSRRDFLGLLDRSPATTRTLLVSTIERLHDLAPELHG